MKNAKLKPVPVPIEEDPVLRVDILAKRLLDRVMTQHCTDPALIFIYARFKPGIEEVLEECLGPVKTKRGKRANK